MTGKQKSNHISRNLTIRCAGALAAVAVMSTIAFLLLNSLLSSQESDAPQINVSGRQRMLSQRISTMSLCLANAYKIDEYQLARELLVSSIELMESSHKSLVEGDQERGISSELADNLREHYFGEVALDRKVREFLTHAKALSQKPLGEISMDDEDLNYVVSNSRNDLLADLNQAVKLYEENSKQGASRMQFAEVCVWVTTLFLLVAEGILIFRPMTKTIVSQFGDLESRNLELSAKDERICLLVDATSDLFVPVDLEGRLTDQLSSRVTDCFGNAKIGDYFWNFLSGDDEELEWSFQMGFEQIVDDILPFEVCVEQAVRRLKKGDRTFEIDYKALEENEIRTGFLLVVRDITSDVINENAEADSKEFSEVVCRAFRDQGAFRRFVTETEGLIETCLNDEHEDETILRYIHTLKGNTSIFGMRSFASSVHRAEDRIQQDANAAPTEVQNLSEIWKSSISRYSEILSGDSYLQISNSEFEDHLVRLLKEDVPKDLLAVVRRWEFESAQSRLQVIADSAHGLANRLGKKVDVRLQVHDNVRLEGEYFGAMWSTLSHVIRNAVDHGIESPEVRSELGKDEAGTLSLECFVENASLILQVNDNGRGIDWERIKERAIQLGYACSTQQELTEALFIDGLSSREIVTETSGRGVGMGAVREEILKIGGEIHVESKLGIGTSVRLIVPFQNDDLYADLLEPKHCKVSDKCKSPSSA